MKTPAVVTTALLVAVALAGCSSGALPGFAGAPSANSAPSAVPSAATTKPAGSGGGGGSGKHVNVCSALTVAAVGSITGRAYVTAKETDTSAKSRCDYYGSDPTSLDLSVGIYYNGKTAIFTQLVSSLGQGDPATPLFDVGDQAVALKDAAVAQFGADDLFAIDEVYPGNDAKLPQGAFVKLFKTLQSAR
jgi:hypothetical protein